MKNYINNEMIEAIRTELRREFGDCIRFNIRARNGYCAEMTINKGTVDLSDIVGSYHRVTINEEVKEGRFRNGAFINSVIEVMQNAPARAGVAAPWKDANCKDFDIFDTHYDIAIKIGGYDRPYERVVALGRGRAHAALDREDPHTVARRIELQNADKTPSRSI